MPKYGVTYKTRKQSKNVVIGAQTEFDLALAAKNEQKDTENCSTNVLEREGKSELKIKRVNRTLENNKKRKLNPLLEDDLFGFDGSDSETPCGSKKDGKIKRTKSPSKKNSPIKQNSPDSTLIRGSPFKGNSNKTSPFKINSPLKSNLKNSPAKGVKKSVKFEDKSTDDEAYGSSQEPNVVKGEDCTVEDERPTKKQVLSGSKPNNTICTV